MTHAFEQSNLGSGGPDDAFFVLRDSRELLERRIAELATRAGIGSKPVVDGFARAVGEAHDELASAKQRDGFESTEGLTASRITLMCDADLELDIRIKDVCKRVADRCNSAMWRVQLRYMTLLNRPGMLPENNPVGPEALSAGMWSFCQASDAVLERKMELLGRLEEIFLSDLSEVYDELNELLSGRNVEAAHAQITQSPNARVPSSAATGGGHGGASGDGGIGNAFAALQQALSAQFGGAPALPVSGSVSGTVGGSASSATGAATGAGTNVALSAATLLMLNQLSARLDQLQAGSMWVTGGIGAGGAATVGGGLPAGGVVGDATGSGAPSDTAAVSGMPASGAPRAIRAADLDLPLGNPEGIALETLGYIFEAMFETWDLPDTVKTAIGRLQIPMLKLSLYDQSLFSDEQHPARRLINAMGRAAAGLPRDVARAHHVSMRLWQIAGNVQETLQGDPAVLDAPLAEVEALIAERNAEAAAQAAPFIDYIASIEAREKDAEGVERWLEEIGKHPSAREIHDFLGRYWVRVMAAAIAEGGEQGSAWGEARQTAEELVWSVQPKVDAEDRKRLATLVATLIRRVNAGLDRIGVSGEERQPFLDVCFNLQTGSLRGAPPPMVTAATEAGSDADAAEGLPGQKEDATATARIPVGGGILLALGRLDGKKNAYRTSAQDVQTGQWLQVTLAGNEVRTGMVAWIARERGTVLLCNPEWKANDDAPDAPLAIAMSAAALDQRRRQGGLSVISARAIFDEAASRALAQIAGGGARQTSAAQ